MISLSSTKRTVRFSDDTLADVIGISMLSSSGRRRGWLDRLDLLRAANDRLVVFSIAITEP